MLIVALCCVVLSVIYIRYGVVIGVHTCRVVLMVMHDYCDVLLVMHNCCVVWCNVNK